MNSRREFYIEAVSDYLSRESSSLKIEDLAASIGVTKKTLYNYFDSKQHLFNSVVDFKIRQICNDSKVQWIDALDPIEALFFVGRVIIDLHTEFLLNPICINNDESKSRFLMQLRKSIGTLSKSVEAKLRQGMENGIFEDGVDIRLLVHVYFSAIEVFYMYFHARNDFEYNKLLHYTIKNFCTFNGAVLLSNYLQSQTTSL